MAAEGSAEVNGRRGSELKDRMRKVKEGLQSNVGGEVFPSNVSNNVVISPKIPDLGPVCRTWKRDT